MSVKKNINKSNKGRASIEYVILLPIVFACVLLCVYIFIFFYEKTVLQSFAEDIAQSISKQWGYRPLPLEEIESGIYKKETYENREIYWNLKPLGDRKKESLVKDYIIENSRASGLLKPYIDCTGEEVKPEITVDFNPGISSVLHIRISMKYNTPVKSLLKLIGLKEYMVIEAKAQSHVYDPKDMINTTDYVYQLISEATVLKDFEGIIKPLKDNLNNFLKE